MSLGFRITNYTRGCKIVNPMKFIQLFSILFSVSLYNSVSVAEDLPIDFYPEQIAKKQTTIEIDVSEIEPGEIAEAEYGGAPVWVYRRTMEDLDRFLEDGDVGLSDEQIDFVLNNIRKKVRATTSLLNARLQLLDRAELEQSPYRSKNNNYFVFTPLGRLGCALQTEMPVPGQLVLDGAVFFDPCSGYQYDSAGRYLSRRAKQYLPSNGAIIRSEFSISRRLETPPHRYTSDGILVVGVEDIHKLPEIPVSREELYRGLTPTETLLVATAFNDFPAAESALGDGADINLAGNFAETGSLALLRAVLYSSIELVDLLVSEGAVAKSDVFEWAERLGRTDVKELLEGKHQGQLDGKSC